MLLKSIKRGFREFGRGKQNVVEEVVFIMRLVFNDI